MKSNKAGRRTIIVAACVAIALLSGCSRSGQSSAGNASNAIPVPAPTGTAASTGAGQASAPEPAAPTAATGSGFSSVPGHMDIGSGASLTPTHDLDSKIAQLQKYGGSKKELAFLYTKRGDERMMDPQASPHVKYPAALDDFRKAVALDPTNREAVNNKNLIEAIYRSMGRSIPGN